MIIQNAFIKGNSLIGTILLKMSGIGKVQTKFLQHILILILCIRGRINFLQLERYGHMSERSYRLNFTKSFDWLSFNKNFVSNECSDELIIGFDPSFISKSGKHTPGVGYFYSGCDSRYERGLEIGCYSVIDVKQNTAYHLYAQQTKARGKDNKEISLMGQYINQISEIGSELSSISKVFVADAYFSKKEYSDAIREQGMELISRLRKDANLKYIYKGLQKQGRGRPKEYDGKVDTRKIDKRRAKMVYSDESINVYSIIVKSVNLGIKINLVWVENKNSKGKEVDVKMYFSTNLQRGAKQILEYYQARYQMEFNFRDGKQFTGLQTCQARSSERLHYHFNATLTAVNIAKSIARNGANKDQSMTLSVQDVKTEMSNYLMLQLFFSKFGIDPNLQENQIKMIKLLNYGKIAA